jgi:AAA+ ATPase superfamily predicted ATPase
MVHFIGRQRETAELSDLVVEQKAQFLILYGRRRVGKTTLLLHWAQQSGLAFPKEELRVVYWVANRLSPTLQLRSFSQTLYNAAHPDTPAETQFTYPTWEMAFEQAAQMATDRRLILILDEFPYVAEAEPGLPSVVQNIWDHRLKETRIFLVLAGSHIGMMSELLQYHAPLYGRFTAHLHLKPMPFAATAEFLPRYTAAERVAVYAILGGIPAYLERFDDRVTLADNVKQRIFRPSGIFRVDPLFLLQDQVREPRNFLSVIHAIGEGQHTLEEIAAAAGLPKQNVSTYLGRLADLHLVERRTPVTLSSERRKRSRQGRWHLLDSYLRFYFRFIVPNQRALELELMEAVWADIRDQLRAFVGGTAFEELCREWVLLQARQGQLPFVPEDIGSHWATNVQVDVVALSWREKAILLGECKWGVEQVGRALLRELVEAKAPKVLAALPGEGVGWKVYYIFFARAGFTEAAQTEAKHHRVTLVDLAQLDQDLQAGGY